MVLEHLFPEDWLEKKARYAFILGIVYSILGIFFAKILFPSDPALVAVAFTSILFLPELYKLFSIEEKEEGAESRFSIRELLKDNGQFIKIYLFISMGIFLVYGIAAIMLPEFQVNTLFREQLEMRGTSGKMIYHLPLFLHILTNNWWVLLACFVISLLSGDGAIFLITWNASMWGTIFGITARSASTVSQTNPFLLFLLVLLIVLPHAFLEIIAYILGAISGGVISKDVILEKFESSRFNEVFLYNSMLFMLGIVFLFLGALVETWVLDNVTIYQEIIKQSLFLR